MAHTLFRLSAIQIAKATAPGLLADAGGLYLRVSGSGAKSWVFRFMLNRRAREMGLGSLIAVPLADAREKAADARRKLADEVDPIAARDAANTQRQLDSARGISFQDCANKYIASHDQSWRNQKHRAQWKSTLATYVYPEFGALPVGAIDTALVAKVVEPLWSSKPETANRLRGRIETILNWAAARGYRQGENPARWRGHSENLLPARSKIRAVQHHAALAYTEISSFLTELEKQPGIPALALEFTILTAARTGETIGARFEEIDFHNRIWIVPATRMKGGREHRVPLSPQVIQILEQRRSDSNQNTGFIFPGRWKETPLSNMAMLKVLARMGFGDLTVHGFRSTFRDWAAERTTFQREVVEAALAHTIRDKVEAAYRRSDILEKRRFLMDAWAQFTRAKPKLSATVLQLERRS